MTNLLLITDVPRLRKVFSHLNDDQEIRLRVANSLEKGGEEIIAEKPDMVFVQTHLSGLSGDILLMHLKKQLGRRRSRFVLLGSSDKISPDVLKLYHGHIDTSLTDNSLFGAVQNIVQEFAFKGKKAAIQAIPTAVSAISVQEPEEAVVFGEDQNPGVESHIFMPIQIENSSASPPPIIIFEKEPTLEEQGVTYSPRARMTVYSEFTKSFESAVSSMQQPPVLVAAGSAVETTDSWMQMDMESADPTPTRSRRVNFLLWFVPVLIAVVVVTMVQHRTTQPKSIDVAPVSQIVPAILEKKNGPAVPVPAPTVQQAVAKSKAAEPDARLGDKAVLAAIAENKGNKAQTVSASAAKRPVALPGFIPRAGIDKAYSAANPGWERYKGEVTEFKVYREGGAIKALQVIDRGGRGVPESFMKGALQQLTKKPSFIINTSEKKDGYEIQRAKVSENLKAVYYRDADGGRLRAFVVTW